MNTLRKIKLLSLSGVICLTYAFTGPAWAGVNIADTPLTVADPLPPNILYILDDSSSMRRQDLPDDVSCDGAGGGSFSLASGRLTSTRLGQHFCQSPDFNKQYYNPNVTYVPPVDHNGNSLGDVNFFDAPLNGYNPSTTLNLSQWNDTSSWWSSPNWEPFFWYRHRNSALRLENGGCTNYDSSSPCRQNSNYTKVSVSLANTEEAIRQRQNIANWFSYYRTRLDTAKAGTMIAFSELDPNFRVGYKLINDAAVSLHVNSFTGSHKKRFYDEVRYLNITGTRFTPLRKSLDIAGKYFESDVPYRDNPSSTNPELLSCFQNFSILMTDGYWTEGDTYAASTTTCTAGSCSGPRLNNDRLAGSEIISADGSRTFQFQEDTKPFSDMFDNTLADVAAYYWKRDLRPNMPNNVPTSTRNPAFWQHMVTIGLTLGVEGTISKTDAFNALENSPNVAINWPNPTSGTTAMKNAAKIDDLLHAAVNSRGDFFSANAPEEFVDGVTAALAATGNKSGSGTSLASQQTESSSYIFRSRYNSETWSGYLGAYSVNANGVPSQTASWEANFPSFADRNVFTWNAEDGKPVLFKWHTLTDAQKNSLKNDESILNYLLGDSSLERRVGNNNPFRSRNGILLGAIINSSPLFVDKPDATLYKRLNYNWDEADTHELFANSVVTAGRKPMIYVSANNGFVHGFNAGDAGLDNGKEVFAYVPSMLISQMPDLSSIDYNPRYFADGELTAADVYLNGWKTILVGSIGRGGKGIFGIDVTNPSGMSKENLLFEFSIDDIPELGQIIGKPHITRLSTGDWVALWGNGFNSSANQAALIKVNLSQNFAVTVITTNSGSVASPNALGAPVSFDLNNIGGFDVAYAGDFLGDVWAFDLVNNGVRKVFSGTPAQPITAPVTVRGEPETNNTWIFFGTGRYLSDEDITDRSLQRWYGIIDPIDRVISHTSSNLVRRDIIDERVVNGFPARVVSSATKGDMNNKDGWYYNLVLNNQVANSKGERMIFQSVLRGNVLLGPTLINNPDANVCDPSGTGFIMAVNAFTGANLEYSFFDYTQDRRLDEGDKVGGKYGSGISFGSIPSVPVIINDRLIVQQENTTLGAVTIGENRSSDARLERLLWREL